MKEKINFGGLFVDPLSLSDFSTIILEHLLSGKRTNLHITGVNPETFGHASDNENVRDAILSSDLINIDNYFVVFVLRLKGYKGVFRVATPDLFEEMLRVANIHGFRVFIFGAEEKVLNQAINNIKFQYKKLHIGSQNGFYEKENEKEIINRIKEFDPHMLFLALPSPQKELLITKFKIEMESTVFLGIGGAIDVKAGIVKRGPKFLRDMGFEGIFRALQNPINYGKRYFVFYPKFVKLAFRNK